jgi:hypothetical protein
MASRFHSGIMTCLVGGAAALGACSSDNHQASPDAAVWRDADFSVCADTPAVMYAAGMTVTSSSAAYVATLDSAITEGTPPIIGPQVGLDTWVVSITNASDGTPATDVTLTAEKPSMPIHMHGATTFPLVTPGDAGKYTLSKIDFFMAGYWEQKVYLQPPGGAQDRAAFAICVPQ